MPLERKTLRNIRAEDVVEKMQAAQSQGPHAFSCVRQKNGNFTISTFFNEAAARNRQYVSPKPDCIVDLSNLHGDNFSSWAARIPESDVKSVVEEALKEGADAILLSHVVEGGYKAEIITLNANRPVIRVNADPFDI